MLTRSHVEPFLRLDGGLLRLEYLGDGSGRVVPFLDRLCRLVQRLEGWPRHRVVEALRRQERHVRDAARLAGLAKTLLDACDFRPPPGAEDAEAIREAAFAARGRRWPPVPGDRAVPYEECGTQLGRSAASSGCSMRTRRPHGSSRARRGWMAARCWRCTTSSWRGPYCSTPSAFG